MWKKDQVFPQRQTALHLLSRKKERKEANKKSEGQKKHRTTKKEQNMNAASNLSDRTQNLLRRFRRRRPPLDSDLKQALIAFGELAMSTQKGHHLLEIHSSQLHGFGLALACWTIWQQRQAFMTGLFIKLVSYFPLLALRGTITIRSSTVKQRNGLFA